ncbi:MAG: hypothetical protein IJC84_01230 [Clostridia bacterium]|nr:hypothetical protein [Clostridia bacterium]
MKKIIAFLLCLVLAASILPANAFAASIASINVDGIALPVDGEKPDFTAVLSGTNASSNWAVSITKVEWVEYDPDWEWEKDMTANDTFKEGYWYVLYVTLEASAGNSLKSDFVLNINGVKANLSGSVTQSNGAKAVGYISYQGAKGDNRKNPISSVELSVVNPVAGKTPTFAKVDTEKYYSTNHSAWPSYHHNGVAWSNDKTGVALNTSNPFQADTTYSVGIILQAKDTYYFDARMSAKINGVKASIIALETNGDKGIVIFVYLTGITPGDGKKVVESIDLNVPAPKDGEKPVYTKLEGTGYYSDNGLNGSSTAIYKNGIAWFKSATSYVSPGTTETFKAESNYILKVSLLPRDGYKFTEGTAVKINGKTAALERGNDGSITASVTFTALKKDHTHSAATDWKSDTEGHWQICADAACGEIVTLKASHTDLNGDNKCDVCTFGLSTSIAPPVSTTPQHTTPVINPDDKTDVQLPVTEENAEAGAQPEEGAQPETEEEEDNGKGEEEKSHLPLILGIAGGVLVLAAVIVVIVLVLKKKK